MSASAVFFDKTSGYKNKVKFFIDSQIHWLGLHVVSTLDRHMDSGDLDYSCRCGCERSSLLHHPFHGGELRHPYSLHLYLQSNNSSLTPIYPYRTINEAPFSHKNRSSYGSYSNAQKKHNTHGLIIANESRQKC